MEMDQKKEWVFIVNPIAGNGFANKLVPTLEEMLKKYNIDAELVFTEHKGHANLLAKSYSSRGFKYTIGVGGDGTLNEIANSLINKENVI